MSNLILLVTALLLGGCLAVSADPWSRLPRNEGFRNVRDYGAKGDGVTDDTQAFLRCLEQGRGTDRFKTPANIYIPPGTYRLSDTLILWRATQLAGDAENPPTLVLAANSPGFDDPAHPKPFLVTAGGYSIDPATRDWRTRTNELGGSTNNTFYITLRHLNLRVEPGNPGAWGLWWLLAQQTALRNVTIDAGEAQGCLRSTWWGGGGVISHLTLLGGDYGWLVDQTSQWLARSVTLVGQRRHSLLLQGVWAFVLLDFHFRHTGPARFNGAAVSLIDADFADISADHAIQADNSHLVLQNVSTQGVGEVVAGLLAAQPEGPTLLRRWAVGPTMVNGQPGEGPARDLSDTLPADYRPLPSPSYPLPTLRTRSVLEWGVTGDGQTDDTAALQRAIDEHDELFLPLGEYLISDTLRLHPPTKLFGEMWSEIRLRADAPGFQEPDSQKLMLEIPDDPEATLLLSHLHLWMDPPSGMLTDWRAGSRSMVMDTSLRHSTTQQWKWRISGGGFFENMWNAAHTVNGLHLTSQHPAWLYMVNQEHEEGLATFVEGARDATLLSHQFEASREYLRIVDSQNITVFNAIAGNWGEFIPSLAHVSGGHQLALFNTWGVRCHALVSEEPHGWTAGPASEHRDRPAVLSAWIKR